MKNETSELIEEECVIEPRPMRYVMAAVGIFAVSAGLVLGMLYGIWRLAHG